MKVPKIKVATTTLKGRKITIYIDKIGEDRYEISAMTEEGMRLNQIERIEQVILGALYHKSMQVNKYAAARAKIKRQGRFANLLEETDDETQE